MTQRKTKELMATMNKNANKLRRELEVQNLAEGTHYMGTQLNRSALVKGVVQAKVHMQPRDLYHKVYRDPDVNAAFSFAIDSSSSMHWNYTPDGTDYWKECHYLLDALHLTLERIGIKTASASAGYSGGYYETKAAGASTPVTPVAKVYKEFHERWTPSSYKKFTLKANGGTCVISWAEVAWQLARESDAQYRMAFFLTDGEDNSARPYLESMRVQALSEGIILVGIGLGLSGVGLPNGISGRNAEQISAHMLEHLYKIIKAGGQASVETKVG